MNVYLNKFMVYFEIHRLFRDGFSILTDKISQIGVGPFACTSFGPDTNLTVLWRSVVACSHEVQLFEVPSSYIQSSLH